MKDYYELLGIQKNASADEIKKGFRKLAHEYHPDKATGDEKKFKEINEAYQVLSDTQKKAQYDQFGHSAYTQQGQGGGGPSWQDFAGQGGFGGQGGGIEFDFGDIGDMFGFGGGRGRQNEEANRQGADMELGIQLAFHEAVFGVQKEIHISRKSKCDHCTGNGAEPGTKIVTCTQCNGSGQVVYVRQTFIGNIQMAQSCPQCHGEGSKAEKPCKECKGEGVRRKEERLMVSIPAGVDEGSTVRLAGQGEAGKRGGHAGDLFIHIRVTPDKRFQRKGDDLVRTLPITFSQAALGDKVTIETLDGNETIAVPPGAIHGQTVTIREKGVPHVRGKGRGNFIVLLHLDTPKHLSKKARELLEELKREGV